MVNKDDPTIAPNVLVAGQTSVQPNATVIDMAATGKPHMLERSASTTSSVRSTSRPSYPAVIILEGSPDIQLERHREQLAKEGITLPKKPPIVHPDPWINANNEDVFTLDTFNGLVQAARAAGKEFLLARVMTIDPGDTNKTYWSYYSAHHINKVLFRTEPGRDYLHRMRCRNPLNNMPIVGEVHYFAVTVSAVDSAWTAYERATGQRIHRSQSTVHAVGRTSMVLDVAKRTYPLPVLNRCLSETNLVAPELQPNTKGTKKAQIEYHAKYIGSEDDFLQRKNFRDIFCQHAVNPTDPQLFPLTHDPNTVILRTLQGHVDATQAEVTENAQSQGSGSYLGLFYWPPRASLMFSRGGLLTEISFVLIVAVSLGVTLTVCLIALPLYMLFISIPILTAVLVLTGCASMHVA